MRAFPPIKDLVTDVSWNFRVKKGITKFTPRPADANGQIALSARACRRGILRSVGSTITPPRLKPDAAGVPGLPCASDGLLPAQEARHGGPATLTVSPALSAGAAAAR